MRGAVLLIAAGCGRLEFSPLADAAQVDAPFVAEPDLRLLFPQHADSFVGYWRMNGDWTDASSTGNDLTIDSGTPTFTSSRNGALAGTFYDASLIVSNRPSIEVAYLSFSVWVQSDLINTPTSNSGHTMFKLSCATCGGDSQIDTAAVLKVDNDGSVDSTGGDSGNGLVQANTWHHVAGTYAANASFLYLDGVRVQSAAGANPVLQSAGGFLWVGRMWPTGAPLFNPQYLHGAMHELAIWNAELTETEIASIYINQR